MTAVLAQAVLASSATSITWPVLTRALRRRFAAGPAAGPGLQPHQPMPASPPQPGPGPRLLNRLDRELLADIEGRWASLHPAVIARGRKVADALRCHCPSAQDSELATGLFQTAHTLHRIARSSGDPHGCYATLITELGVACHDLTAFDRTDQVQQ